MSYDKLGITIGFGTFIYYMMCVIAGFFIDIFVYTLIAAVLLIMWVRSDEVKVDGKV